MPPRPCAPRLALPALFCCLLVCTLSLGCKEKSPEQGIVARVNNAPIYLHTLQALQDTRTVSLGTSQRPSVEMLKRQYGAALFTLIMHSLVMQELDQLGLAVPESQVQAAEAEVRADYPADAFEKTLTEEYIDIAVWRDLLRQQLSMAAFQNKVLRPQLSVSLEEAERYYKKNKQEFTIPATITLIQVSGTQRKKVEALRSKAATLPDSLEEDSPDLTVQRFTIRRQSVPADWDKEVKALDTKQSSPIKNRDGYYQFVTLVDQHPQKDLRFLDAYPLICDVLLEEKIDASFNQWLEVSLKNAQIQVAEHLLPAITEKREVAPLQPEGAEEKTAAPATAPDSGPDKHPAP